MNDIKGYFVGGFFRGLNVRGLYDFFIFKELIMFEGSLVEVLVEFNFVFFFLVGVL